MSFAGRTETVPWVHEIKRLMSGGTEQQRIAVNRLNNELKTVAGVGHNLLLQKLVESGVIVFLCGAVTSLHGSSHQRSVFKCLARFSANENFYKQNYAADAVESILRVAHFMIKNDNDSQCLTMAIHTVANILNGLSTFAISLSTVCKVDQLLNFLTNLQAQISMTDEQEISVAVILGIILEYTPPDIDNDGLALISLIFQKSLNAMKKIAERKKATKVLETICFICAMGTPFCLNDDDDDDLYLETVFGDPETRTIMNKGYKNTFEKSIYVTITEVVIPWLINLDLDPKHDIVYLYFVKCLNDVYEFNNCNLNELSNQLVGLGYLKILSGMTSLPIQNLRVPTLRLISQVLTRLAILSLSISEHWPGGLIRFQRFLFSSLVSLPVNLNEWAPSLGSGGKKSEGLLVLYYYTFNACPSEIAELLPYLMDYVLSLPISGFIPIPLMKSLWFLIAMSAMSHPNLRSVLYYDTALIRLSNMLQSVELKQCYTHHPAILYHSLHNAALSDKLQSDVVSLWLESGGDVKLLIDVDIELTCHCLLDVIRTGSCTVVRLAMGAVLELVKNKNTADELANVVWGIITQVLASYDTDNGENVRSILRIASLLIPEHITNATIIRTSHLLMNIIIKTEDLPLKTLAIKEAYNLLVLLTRKNDSRALTMFLNEPAMLRELQTYAFANDDPELSFVCSKYLSYTVFCQAKFAVQCDKGVEIEMKDLVIQLTKTKECLGILRLLNVLLVYKIAKPAISFREISDDADRDKIINALYLQLTAVHAKIGFGGRDVVYRCLAALLNYCAVKKHMQILKHLSMQPWTLTLIRMTLNTKQITSHFVDFVKVWFFYRKSTDPEYLSNCDGSRALARNKFEQTLDLIGEFLTTSNPKTANFGTFARLNDSLMLFEGKLSKDLVVKLKQKYNQIITI